MVKPSKNRSHQASISSSGSARNAPLMPKNDASWTKFVLAGLRKERILTQMRLNRIDVIGVALKGGLIDEETAIAWAENDLDAD